jgi:hypothetical protein
VCQEGLIDIRFIEDEHVATRSEFHGALKMRFVHFPVGYRALKFHALGMDRASGSPTADGDNPGKTKIDHGRRLGLIAEDLWSEVDRVVLSGSGCFPQHA